MSIPPPKNELTAADGGGYHHRRGAAAHLDERAEGGVREVPDPERGLSLLTSRRELTTIVNYAVKQTLSDLPCADRVLSGNTLWELSEHGDLISVCVIDPTGSLSDHCRDEQRDEYAEDSDWESIDQSVHSVSIIHLREKANNS